MNKHLTRRTVLAAIAAAVPALAIARHAKAAASQATGMWKTLERATDGTDPSTALADPPPPRFTPEILALAGQQVELSGYLTPLSGGFGKKQEYLLSRDTFHCPYCYTSGRGSLALTDLGGHVPQSGKVTVKGTLVVQNADPNDFYFQLKNAKVA